MSTFIGVTVGALVFLLTRALCCDVLGRSDGDFVLIWIVVSIVMAVALVVATIAVPVFGR